MILNILILIFLIGMFFWWGNQGLFSAMLHLLVVIVAGTLTFAVWEPFAYMLLGTETIASLVAWGVALLAGFALILGTLRFALDKLVPQNVHFRPLVNTLAGGVVGAVAGLLTAGIVVLGLQHLPISGQIAGFNPMTISGGEVVKADSGQLWVPVDDLAADFFTMLSTGAFSSSTTIRDRYEDLARDTSVFRTSLEFDENLSLAANPDAVSTGKMRAFEEIKPSNIPSDVLANWGGEGGFKEAVGDGQLVMVPLEFFYSKAMMNGDGTLRVPPTQVRLVVDEGGETKLLQPLGSTVELSDKERMHYAPTGKINFMFHRVSEGSSVKTWWVFGVKKGQEIEGIKFRKLYLSLADTGTERFKFTTAGEQLTMAEYLGELSDDLGDAKPTIVVKKTTDLPEPFNKNWAQGSFSEADQDEQAIREGRDSLELRGRVAKEASFQRIFVPEGETAARLEFDYTDAGLTRRALNKLEDQGAKLWVKTKIGTEERQTFAVAYQYKPGDSKRITTHVNGLESFERAGDVPLDEIRGDDKLWVFFRIEKVE